MPSNFLCRPGKPTEKISRIPQSTSTRRKALFTPSSHEKENSTKKAQLGQTYAWSEKESACLVELIVLFWDRNDSASNWPKFKDNNFCSSCAKYVAENSHADNVRTGDAIQSKVIKYLSVNFDTIEDAENHFKIDYIHHQHNIDPSQAFGTSFATGKTHLDQSIQQPSHIQC